jgi:hypothetical protein
MGQSQAISSPGRHTSTPSVGLEVGAVIEVIEAPPVVGSSPPVDELEPGPTVRPPVPVPESVAVPDPVESSPQARRRMEDRRARLRAIMTAMLSGDRGRRRGPTAAD